MYCCFYIVLMNIRTRYGFIIVPARQQCFEIFALSISLLIVSLIVSEWPQWLITSVGYDIVVMSTFHSLIRYRDIMTGAASGAGNAYLPNTWFHFPECIYIFGMKLSWDNEISVYANGKSDIFIKRYTAKSQLSQNNVFQKIK